MANLQRNFKTLQPGRYQNNRNRLVVIQPNPEDVTITDAGVTQTRKRWTGLLYKADGTTLETNQYFEADGSFWNQRGVVSEYDLSIFDYNSAAVPA